MGTLLKYLFYVLIIAAIYFIGVGLYQGTITKDSTLGEVTDHVTSNTSDAVKDGYNATKDAIQGGIDEIKNDGENEVQVIEEEVNN